MKIGFVGLGRMGQGMARRLLDAGHELNVFDIVAEHAQRLAAAGATAVASIAELAHEREVVVSMLVEDRALRDVTLGEGGLRDSLPKGTIHLVMGTHGIATIRELEGRHAEASQTLVAAPVLGRPDLAASGQLGIVPGGPEDAIERVMPLLERLGRRIFRAGPKPESAAADTLANNSDPSLSRAVEPEVFCAAPAYRSYARKMVDRGVADAASPLSVVFKDAPLTAEPAILANVPMPSHNVSLDRLLGAVAHGDADRDQ